MLGNSGLLRRAVPAWPGSSFRRTFGLAFVFGRLWSTTVPSLMSGLDQDDSPRHGRFLSGERSRRGAPKASVVAEDVSVPDGAVVGKGRPRRS